MPAAVNQGQRGGTGFSSSTDLAQSQALFQTHNYTNGAFALPKAPTFSEPTMPFIEAPKV